MSCSAHLNWIWNWVAGLSQILHVAAAAAAVRVHSQLWQEVDRPHVDSLSESDLSRVRLEGFC